MVDTFKLSPVQPEEAPSNQAIARVNDTNFPHEYQVIPQPSVPSSFDSPESFAIIAALSNYIFPFLARRIGIFLEPYLSSRSPPVTDVRAVVIPSFQNDEESWPIVQWKELDTKQMAIFMMDPAIGILSCLFHSATGQEQNELQWPCSYLTWYLETMDHLFDMLEVVQQVLGLSQWQDPGMVDQLFDPTQPICSEEE